MADTQFTVGYIIGSLSKDSINRRFAEALVRLAPENVTFREIPIAELPVYNRDADADYPAVAVDFKEQIAACDALLYVTPEYNRSIPGSLKNAIDWASRPWGKGVLGRPSAIAGASMGGIGSAVAQAHLKSIVSFFGPAVQPAGALHPLAGDPGQGGWFLRRCIGRVLPGLDGRLRRLHRQAGRLSATTLRGIEQKRCRPGRTATRMVGVCA